MHFQTSLLATSLLAGLALAGTITVVEIADKKCAFEAKDNVFGCGLNGAKEISDTIGEVRDGACHPAFEDKGFQVYVSENICNGGNIQLGFLKNENGDQNDDTRILAYTNKNEDFARCQLSDGLKLGSHCDPIRRPWNYKVPKVHGFSTAAATPTPSV